MTHTLNNEEHQEAVTIDNSIKKLCKHYGFETAIVNFGDADGNLIFVIEGQQGHQPCEKSKKILGIIKSHK